MEVTSMEPQDCYYDKKPAKKRNCFGIIATILLASLAVVIGLIIGLQHYHQ